MKNQSPLMVHSQGEEALLGGPEIVANGTKNPFDLLFKSCSTAVKSCKLLNHRNILQTIINIRIK